jgi:adhesin/invasin
MISRQKRPAKRRAAAAVVFGSAVAVLASPLALGSAAAATPVTNVTVTSTANAPAGGNATINVHYDPAQDPAVPIDYTVLGGIAGDTDAAFAGHDCVSNTNGTAVCTVHNSGTAGTDNVRVFADENNNDVWDGGEKSADTNVVFAGPIDKITLTSPTSSATNTCAQFTAHVTDSNGKGAAGRDVKLTVNETATATPGSDPITYYAGGCSGSTSTATNDVSGNNITFTHTVTVPTDNSGDVVFGLSSSAPGTANVIVASAANANIKDQDTVSFGPGGTNGVANVTVTSATTVTNYTGTTADFTVKATNGSGNPVQGVTVNKQTNSGPDTLAPTPCGTTNASGTVTCSITNGGTAGTDQLTFWVDNDADGAHTSGPDANEPKTTATAVFIAQPVVSGANSNVTCEQQLAGPNQGNAVGTCTLPTSQHSVVFTAKVADASNDPIQGAVVTFTATSAKLGGATVSGANLPTGTATTNANGVATFTVNNPNAANGDNVTVSAKVGAQAVGDATANWAGAQATELTVTPELQSVTNGGTVTVTAKVTDQFGNPVAGSPNITYTVTGRNAGKNGSAAADGTITYQDTNVNPGSDTDTISVIDNTHAFHATATVNFITGPATPSTVTVDTSGAGTTNTTCAIAGHNPATGVALQGTTEVCAVVKNANDEPLAGQSVTFTVSNGQVAAVGALSANSGTTYHATTDAKGVAFADVTSTTSGAQTVTATAGSVSGTGTVTYLNPTPAQAKSITVDPETVTITPGVSQ